MKKNRWILRLVGLLLVCGALNVTAAVAVEAGSTEDPLVTVSYLNEVFLQDVLEKVNAEIAQRNQKIVQAMGGQTVSAEGGAVNTFTVVTLSNGQVLTGDIGCEVMLRVGSAVCVSASAPGLIDETSGVVLNGGSALTANHLYMMTIEGRGVRATTAVTKVLVRGSYTIG